MSDPPESPDVVAGRAVAADRRDDGRVIAGDDLRPGDRWKDDHGPDDGVASDLPGDRPTDGARPSHDQPETKRIATTDGPSERRYRDLVAHAPLGQAVYQVDGGLVDANEAWLRLLDYEHDEVLGIHAASFVHPEDRAPLVEAIPKLIRGEIDHFHDERRLLRKDGTPIWVSSNITVERDADGRAELFHSLVIDIGANKIAEEALRQSEAKYRQLIHRAPVAQAITDLEGALVEFNQAFIELMRSTADDLLARSATDLIHPDDLPELRNEIRRLVAGEAEYFEVEQRFVRPDESTGWVIGGTSLLRDGDRLLLHTVMQDITDRRDAADALRDNETRYRAVIDSLHDGLVVHTGTAVLTANNGAARILGVDQEQLLDIGFVLGLEVYDADRRPVPSDQRPSLRALREGTPSYDVTHGIVTAEGDWCWFLTNAVPLYHDDDSSPYAVALSFTDITERKEAEDALRESEIRFRTLAESLPVGVFHTDSLGTFDYANPRWAEITDVDPADVNDPTTVEIIHPDDREPLWLSLLTSFQENRPYHVQYRIYTSDGSIRWLSGRGARMLDPGTGEPTGLVGSIEDITPLVVAQEQNARLASIVESTSDSVGIVEWATGRFTYLNRSARQLFGYPERADDEQPTEVHYLDLLTPEGARTVEESLLPALRRDEVWSGELDMRRPDGSMLTVWQTVTGDRGADGTIYQVFSVGRDVTERRRLEEDLAWQATHDSHTGLPNRALLLDHLEMGLARAERDNRTVALLFLDLDRFKQVNDSLGHEAGDDLLAQAAKRISLVLRPTDTVARIGGDEFVILAEDVEDEDHAIAIGQRVATAIDGAPFEISDQTLEVTASIGIAVSRGREAHPEALLRDADAAMYRAKDLGRARLEVFDESMRQRAARRTQLADQLATGIERGDIKVYYQPCVDLTTGRITGVEALARWAHPDRGVLSPYEFIALAEETGLIVGLGLVVLSKACRQGYLWQERFGEDAPRVHVNLSARQLTATNLPTLVEGVLDGTGLKPNKLCLEITESVLMDDAAAVIDTLWALKGIGVSIAIDDFGTGYSSLSYLRRFPVDVLKVDQSFVDGLGPDPEDSAIVAAIVNLAASLELDAVAEGVETREQLDRLRALGCRDAQGFLFSEPQPPQEIERLFGTVFDL